jgi:L-asparaginase
MQVVYLISTGGTIDKVYSENTGSVRNVDSKVSKYLAHLRLYNCEVRQMNLMSKDSLEMTDSDREEILCAVTRILPERAPIVVTHGTDTMVQTGLYLQEHVPALEVPIVLTGAMIPLGFEGSDGLQNLTESLITVRLLGPGVHLVMHNQVFPIHRVRKDRVLSRFVWVDPS